MRKPRYAAALLIGIAYFALLLFSDDDETRRRGFGPAAELIGPLIAALYLSWAWLWGGHRHALAFSPAEVQHLFTAPVSRRTLLHFKLARAQLAIAFSAVLLSVIVTHAALPWWLRIPSFWLLLTTTQFHQVAASLVHASTEAHGARGAKRNAIAVAVFAVAFCALLGSVLVALPELRGVTSVEELTQGLGDVLRGPVPNAVMYPLRLLLGPILAPDGMAWLKAVGPALILLVLHYIWVLRSDAAFEESAADAGLWRARYIEAARRGRSPAQARARPAGATSRQRALLFPLRSHGHPATALLWKNLVAFLRGLRRNTVFFALVALPIIAVVVLGSVDSPERAATGLGGAALTIAAFVAVLGPLGIRNDLRQDLAHAALLRTYPLRGRTIVGAEIASAALVLTAAQLVLAGIALASFAFGGALRGAVAIVPLAALGMIAIVPFNALAVAIQNGLALFFPDWIHIGGDEPGGVEFMGQHVLRLAGSMLLLGVGLLPPLLVAGAAAFQLFPVLGVWSLLPGAAAGVAALWAEVVGVVVWLGNAFERIDPVEAGLRI